MKTTRDRVIGYGFIWKEYAFWMLSDSVGWCFLNARDGVFKRK